METTQKKKSWKLKYQELSLENLFLLFLNHESQNYVHGQMVFNKSIHILYRSYVYDLLMLAKKSNLKKKNLKVLWKCYARNWAIIIVIIVALCIERKYDFVKMLSDVTT